MPGENANWAQTFWSSNKLSLVKRMLLPSDRFHSENHSTCLFRIRLCPGTCNKHICDRMGMIGIKRTMKGRVLTKISDTSTLCTEQYNELHSLRLKYRGKHQGENIKVKGILFTNFLIQRLSSYRDNSWLERNQSNDASV